MAQRTVAPRSLGVSGAAVDAQGSEHNESAAPLAAHPPIYPSAADTLAGRYHLDLAALSSTALVTEEAATRLRCLAARPSPRDLERLAARAARLSREEGGR